MKDALTCLFLMFTLTGCGMFAAVGPVEEDPGKRTRGARVEDESIETKSNRKIAVQGDAFQSANISINSFNGFVLITGQVPEQDMKSKLSDLVREIRGVRRIYNEVEISGNTSGLVRSSDTWLTTKVKSSLLAAEDIQGGRVMVVTENGVVYLMGLVSHAEGERVVAIARSTGGVQKVVQIFEWID